MTTTKHTPGPWCLVGDDEGGPLSIMTTREAPTKVECVFDCTYDRSDFASDEEWEQCVADHRLMAAAPDILAACEAAIEAMPNATPTQAMARRRLTVAIAKARWGVSSD